MIDLPGQQKLFDTGEPVRRRPSREEIEAAIREMVKICIWKNHRGRPPKEMGGWEDLFQEVSYRTLQRLKNFMIGGRFTLCEYTYMAAYYSLRDIQREDMKKRPPENYFPLFDNDIDPDDEE